MRNRSIKQQIQKIDELFGNTASASSGNIELQSHWAKYLCVLSAGLIENALSQIYIDFVKSAASEPVVNYASAMLSKIQNPKTNRFIEIAGSFKKTWGEQLEVYVNEKGRKEAIDSIMSNRHLIAHGKQSGITIVRLRQWLDKSIDVLHFVETLH